MSIPNAGSSRIPRFSRPVQRPLWITFLELVAGVGFEPTIVAAYETAHLGHLYIPQ